MDDDRLARSRALHRRTGRTFYYATRLLPPRVRDPTYALYGFFRVADEIVDGEGGPDDPAAQHAALDRLRRQALGEEPTDDPVVDAFARVRRSHDIPAAEVETFVEAMQTDIDHDHYEDFAALREYMRGSAAAVGHMMTAVMDPSDSTAARPHAAALGQAFQLTNFVRDVREDVEDLGRVYLPRQTLRYHGVTADDLERESATDGLRDAVRAEMLRAEGLYREGVQGIDRLPRDCQLPVLTAAVLYAEHHRLIRARNYDVLANPPSLGTARKTYRLARTFLAWRRLGDPVAVFRRVSAVPDQTEVADSPDPWSRASPE